MYNDYHAFLFLFSLYHKWKGLATTRGGEEGGRHRKSRSSALDTACKAVDTAGSGGGVADDKRLAASCREQK